MTTQGFSPEFELIARHFTRPAANAVLGVGDDAALLTVTHGMDLAVSMDTMVSGTHFFPDVDPENLGHKALAVNLSDMAAMGALASLAGAVDMQSDKETANGYEKIGKVNGRMTTEEFDRQSKSGKYSVLVANRFMVEAQGDGADMGELKGAVSSVGLDKLEGMAHG